MPRQADHSDDAGTLPSPELNPLLNPLLAQNMGRWAEVYFTSPPEKREQAVLELLRELQGDNPQHNVTNAAPASLAMEPAAQPEVALAPALAEAQPAGARCHRCGRENPASHRFCGMCGIALEEQPTTTGIHVADLHVADLHVENHHVDGPTEDRRIDDWHIDDRPAPSAAAVYEPALHANELSLFRSAREGGYSDDIFSDPPASRSYRVYLGVALATVILALAYMAWRSSLTNSGNSHVESQAPNTATSHPAEPAPAVPRASRADTQEQSSLSQAADTPSREAAADPARGEAVVGSGTDTIAKAAPAPAPPAAENPPAERLAGNGAEELAMAQSYLHGANGEPRNSTEAAKWLWKAIAKHNGNATVLLADLYLKGDGVPKNCDQARILLDSAALQGTKDAGERLRHLQAFGCN